MSTQPEALRLANRLSSSDPDFDDCTDAAAELRRLHKELEREQMRLAACGVVAMADTPDSATHARKMHPDYESASCSDVARRVDECIRLRALNQDLLEALETALQAFAEMRHAYMRPDWFTDGERAATQHLLMWQQRGIEATRGAIAKANGAQP